MDRVTDFESGGWGFDSLWGRFVIFSDRHFDVAKATSKVPVNFDIYNIEYS